MIIAIVVSITSAQGITAQDEWSQSYSSEYLAYEHEQHQYTEIEIVELPMSLQNAIANSYNSLRLYKAYISKDNTYKVVLKGDEDYTKIVFANAKGEWIEPNNKS